MILKVRIGYFCKMKHLVIIGTVWPEPTSTAAGTRMLQIMEVFQKENYTITFLSSASKGENSFELESIGVTTKSIQLNDSSFDVLIAQLNPTIVLFDRFMIEEQFGWRVLENCPKAMTILDTEDLHCLRKTREICLKNNIDFSFDELKKQEITKREIASILRCDVSLIISIFEMDFFVW